MIERHRQRRHELIDRGEVREAGFLVGSPTGATRHVVLHRRRNGCWHVVDRSELADLPADRQREAISLAVAVVGGLDVIGRTVTAIEVGDDLRWGGVWRAPHRRAAEGCKKERDQGGFTC
jgi:hypothetical protein